MAVKNVKLKNANGDYLLPQTVLGNITDVTEEMKEAMGSGITREKVAQYDAEGVTRYYIDWSQYSTGAGVTAEINKAAALKKDPNVRMTVVFYGTISSALAKDMNNVTFASNMNYRNTSEYTGFDGGANGGFMFNGLTNVKFENFSFVYGQANNNPTLAMANCIDVEFISCTFKNSIIYPVGINSCQRLYFENCTFSGSTQPITGKNACIDIIGTTSTWVMFENCVMEKSRGYAIQVSTAPSSDFTLNVTGCIINGSTDTPVTLSDISNSNAKVFVSTVNIPAPTSATQGQVPIADGQGGASWGTVGGGGASYFGHTLGFNNQTGGSINCGVLGTYNGNYGWHTIVLDNGWGTIDGEEYSLPTITNASLMYIDDIYFKYFESGELKLLNGTVVNSKSAFEAHTKTFYVVYTDTEIGWSD